MIDYNKKRTKNINIILFSGFIHKPFLISKHLLKEIVLLFIDSILFRDKNSQFEDIQNCYARKVDYIWRAFSCKLQPAAASEASFVRISIA